MANKPDTSKVGPVGVGGAPPDGWIGQAPGDLVHQRATGDAASVQATPEQVARARSNERELAPLTFKDSVAPATVRPPVLPGQGAQTISVPAGSTIILGPDGQPAVAPIPGTTESPIIPPDGLPNTKSIVPPSAIPGPRPGLRGRLAAIAQRAADVVAGRPPERLSVEDQQALEDAVKATVIPAQVVPPPEQSSAIPPPAPVELPKRHVAERPSPEQTLAARAAERSPDEPYYPAGSNTDSPSRGIPQPIDDPGKKITGGFGDAGDAQYFPLDGTELREVAYGLMDALHSRLADDLRFSMAITYPRVAVRLELHVDAYANDGSFVVPTVARPHDKTPIDVAREMANQVVFIVGEEHREVSPDGESVTAPNAARRALGLEVPFKRPMRAGASTIMVDREN